MQLQQFTRIQLHEDRMRIMHGTVLEATSSLSHPPLRPPPPCIRLPPSFHASHRLSAHTCSLHCCPPPPLPPLPTTPLPPLHATIQGDDLDYLGIPGFHIAGGQGVAVIAVAQALLMVGTATSSLPGRAASHWALPFTGRH